MTPRNGGCLCGKIRFTVSADPIISGACYCRDCQYVAGGGAAYGMMVPTEALSITRGEATLFVVTSDRGTKVVRAFCPDCGVHLFSYNDANADFRSVKIGAMDDPENFQSQGTVWAASAQPWHHIDRSLMVIDGNPEFQV